MIPGLCSGERQPKRFAMLIGVPKEVKSHEYRVGLVPGSVRELVHHGHKVVVETGAGIGIGFDDRIYEAAGAEILTRAADVFAASEMMSRRAAAR
jgi:alanine dehydrogenase